MKANIHFPLALRCKNLIPNRGHKQQICNNHPSVYPYLGGNKQLHRCSEIGKDPSGIGQKRDPEYQGKLDTMIGEIEILVSPY